MKAFKKGFTGLEFLVILGFLYCSAGVANGLLENTNKTEIVEQKGSIKK